MIGWIPALAACCCCFGNNNSAVDDDDNNTHSQELSNLEVHLLGKRSEDQSQAIARELCAEPLEAQGEDGHEGRCHPEGWGVASKKVLLETPAKQHEEDVETATQRTHGDVAEGM